MSENLLAEDHPAISTPTTETAEIAITKKSPTSRFSAQTSFPNGMTAKTRITGTTKTAGAREKTQRSAARGTTSSFWMNLTPSAMSCAHPWKRPASMGPSRCCMWARTLCSAYPITSGAVRKKAMIRTTLMPATTQKLEKTWSMKLCSAAAPAPATTAATALTPPPHPRLRRARASPRAS